jgi:hypothetical protein
VIVYRDAEEIVGTGGLLRDLRRQTATAVAFCTRDDITSLLIDCGELESAVADAIFPDADGLDPLAQAFRRATLAAGDAFVRSMHGEAFAPGLLELARLLDGVPEAACPPTVRRRISEGYAYYSLHPETYAVAAADFVVRARPASVVCLGVRSIGTSLSAVVAAALRRAGVPALSLCVRPRGHPFNRAVRLASGLEAMIRREAAVAHFAVVDEGPGLSGSSFASVVDALLGLGVTRDRIALFPSWNGDPASFKSTRARQVWGFCERFVAIPERIGAGLSALTAGAPATDFSAGKWRERLYDSVDDWPAVHPQHERVKALAEDAGGILRFAGLGRYGRMAQARAQLIADGGFGVPPRGLCNGYLHLPFVPGTPCSTRDVSEEFLERIASYLAFRRAHGAAARSPGFEEMLHMIETNAHEASVELCAHALRSDRATLEDAPATAIDARMQAHEWIRGTAGFWKTDALDHAFDHFFPGPQDVLWDIAGAEAELRLDQHAAGRLLDRYVAESGDGTAPRRLPFYRIAYAAFQVGYTTMAAQSLGELEDGGRFAVRRDWFVRRLRALVS